MSDTEKKQWMQALVCIWAVPGILCALYALTGPPQAGEGALRVLGWYFIGTTAIYGLIASWRAAYIAGRKRR
ncbi:hypothetical protein [Microbacterium sp. KSW4-4]|uniref:hypothetical protein n=1 Tax=Microbacterium sp. KSW4-4 TaxID=2851651 RepID=UPI001FFD09DD|nr:hypothetical protein [Microbacterium sp. KSW4-4]MCK2034454.1 hypothetical protein [Microbacterium sp. KSW4-4]